MVGQLLIIIIVMTTTPFLKYQSPLLLLLLAPSLYLGPKTLPLRVLLMLMLSPSSHSCDAIELKLEETMSFVASVPDELVDRGRIDCVVLLVHSDNVLVVVLIESTDDSRQETLGGPLPSLLNVVPSSCGNTLRSPIAPLLVFWPTPAAAAVPPPRPLGVTVVDVVGLLLEA